MTLIQILLNPRKAQRKLVFWEQVAEQRMRKCHKYAKQLNATRADSEAAQVSPIAVFAGRGPEAA